MQRRRRCTSCGTLCTRSPVYRSQSSAVTVDAAIECTSARVCTYAAGPKQKDHARLEVSRTNLDDCTDDGMPSLAGSRLQLDLAHQKQALHPLDLAASRRACVNGTMTRQVNATRWSKPDRLSVAALADHLGTLHKFSVSDKRQWPERKAAVAVCQVSPARVALAHPSTFQLCRAF